MISLTRAEGLIAQLEATQGEKERLKQYARFYGFEARVEKLMSAGSLTESGAVLVALEQALAEMRK